MSGKPGSGSRQAVRDVRSRAAVLVGLAAGLALAVWAMNRYVFSPTEPEPAGRSTVAGDLAALRDAQQRALESYGWVDREAGIARIPVDEAMREIASREQTFAVPASMQTGD